MPITASARFFSGSVNASASVAGRGVVEPFDFHPGAGEERQRAGFSAQGRSVAAIVAASPPSRNRTLPATDFTAFAFAVRLNHSIQVR